MHTFNVFVGLSMLKFLFRCIRFAMRKTQGPKRKPATSHPEA